MTGSEVGAGAGAVLVSGRKSNSVRGGGSDGNSLLRTSEYVGAPWPSLRTVKGLGVVGC
jgi:hypothetical protein